MRGKSSLFPSIHQQGQVRLDILLLNYLVSTNWTTASIKMFAAYQTFYINSLHHTLLTCNVPVTVFSSSGSLWNPSTKATNSRLETSILFYFCLLTLVYKPSYWQTGRRILQTTRSQNTGVFVLIKYLFKVSKSLSYPTTKNSMKRNFLYTATFL